MERLTMKKETGYFYKYHFKLAAVHAANHPDIQTRAVAEALNIHPFMLSRWKKQMRDGVLRKDNNKSSDKNLPNDLLKARQEIYMLRQQLKRAQDENKVLKKAERIFPEKK
jgi:transposase-like protein